MALIVPGIYLTLHWAGVAQAAAIEHEGWLPALRRSGQLSDGHYLHIAIFLVMVGVIATAPAIVGDIVLGHHGASAAVFVIGLVVEVITTSFAALASALLYYDLLVRLEPSAEPVEEAKSVPGSAVVATGSADLMRRYWNPEVRDRLDRLDFG